MTRHLMTLALSLPLLAGGAHLAQAQGAPCAAHEVVQQRLADGYGETRQAIALSHDGTVVEIYASSETGSWTITLTRPGGPTCLVASGMAYQPLDEALPQAEAPA